MPAETHGAYKTKLYAVWLAMRNRCTNSAHRHYGLYGGRGITTCPTWDDFTVFQDWANANGYQEGLTIDRKENNVGYNPGNCRWVGMTTQSRNRNKQRGGTSKFIGVNWDTQRGKWYASITVNKKYKSLGRHTDEVEAAKARDAYIKDNNLSDFVLNFP